MSHPSKPPAATAPRLKKSETLEIRLPYPAKQAFMAACRERGCSASEALRRFIDAQVDAPPPQAQRGLSRRAWRLIAGAAVAAAMGAAAVPSLARPSLRAEFDRLDPAHHGYLTPADFTRLDADHDGKVTFEEFRAAFPGR